MQANDRHLEARMRRVRPGLSLIEVLITLAIFITLATFLFMAVREIVTQWKLCERRRSLYEKASGVVDIMIDDIRLAATREPLGATEVKCKFIGDYAPDTEGAKLPRLMFVRTFEAGPERALVGNAGDGRSGDIAFRAPNSDAPEKDPPPVSNAESYTGLKTGDFKALGGMAMVAYFVKDKTLYRALKSPVEGSLAALAEEAKAQTVATDVLYLRFEYWGQDTLDWDATPARDSSKNTGPHRIWDSTRGIDAHPFTDFFLHRKGSLDDPSDDVFPRKVRVTVVVDSSMPRCLNTRLLEHIGDGDTDIEVDNVKGFADGEDEDSYLLIDDEWMHYKRKAEGVFYVDKRGARETHPREHKRDAVVRTGKVFQRVVFIPNWREDFTTDEAYYEKKKEQTIKPKSIMSK